MASNTEVDIEALRREHQEKIRQIAEKRKQVEELKRRRAAKGHKRSSVSAERRGSTAGAGVDGENSGRTVDDLLAEVLRSGDGGAGPPPQGPLLQLARGIGAAKASAAELQVEVGVTKVVVDTQELDTYDRSVQTEQQGTADEEGEDNKGSGERSLLSKLAEKSHQAQVRAVKPESGPGSGQGHRRAAPQQDRRASIQEPAVADDSAPKAEAAPPAELTEEQRKQILAHPNFQAFFNRASLIVERVLGQEVFDVTADVSGGALGDGQADGGANETMLQHKEDYSEERWSLGRSVTDLRFSPSRPELFLAAYGKRASPALSDPDGCMLVWNLVLKSRPEVAFTCQSSVLTAQSNRFNPALFFGGTYAGGIVQWDARAKAVPVLRTPLSSKGHNHPVLALQQVGTQNATNIVSASNDGRLCVWSLPMMATPQETIDLKNESKNKGALGVMCMGFPENETNILYVGAEDGSLCQCHIHGTRNVTESYDGHKGPITGIDIHPQGENVQPGMESLSDLAITTSFDWSVKVWHTRQYQQPVLSLDTYEDYVYDARWHPKHPAAFATVDGEGHVDLWNLNKDMESPVVRMDSKRKLALNRCHWSADGKRLATGDSEGCVSMYTVDRSIVEPRSDQHQQFQERVRQFQPLQQNRQPQESHGVLFNLQSVGHGARH